jgi:autophagy-related protein 2
MVWEVSLTIQVPGWERLSTNLQDAWTPDVKANQIADIVSGVSPIRSLVNVGSGVADLILLPIEQYRKDGRIGRGVQKGGHSFVRSTAMEMMKLGARLATGTQVVLEKAEGVLGGARPVLPEVEVDEETLSRYANQPGSTREGIQAGYSSLSRNINSAAQTILAVPMEVYERSGDDVSPGSYVMQGNLTG